MTDSERRKLQEDYSYLNMLLDFYAKNRQVFQSMTDAQYKEHIDHMLDEMNRIKKLLKENGEKN